MDGKEFPGINRDQDNDYIYSEVTTALNNLGQLMQEARSRTFTTTWHRVLAKLSGWASVAWFSCGSLGVPPKMPGGWSGRVGDLAWCFSRVQEGALELLGEPAGWFLSVCLVVCLFKHVLCPAHEDWQGGTWARERYRQRIPFG